MKKFSLLLAGYFLAVWTVAHFIASHVLWNKNTRKNTMPRDAFGFFAPSKQERADDETGAPSIYAPLRNENLGGNTLVRDDGALEGQDGTIASRHTATTIVSTIATPTDSSAVSPLGEFFRLLCSYNVSECCRKESRLDLLDHLSLTLGEAQTYPQNPFGKLPPPAKEPVLFSQGGTSGLGADDNKLSGLNCSRYQYEITKSPGEDMRNVTTSKEVLNKFRRRRLVFIPPSYNPRLLRPMFDGTAKKPRQMVDVLMVSHELDILQARMHHFYAIMDHFVIIESGYNHRGWKKHRFVQEELAKVDNRFEQFRDKMIYVDIDECPLYMEEVQKERANGTGVGGDIWPIQERMRECVWPTTKPHIAHLEDTALVMMADLDWLPCYDDLVHIRHCEPSEAYGGYGSHIRMGLKQKMRTSFVGEQPGKDYMNEKFSLTALGRAREIDSLPARGFPNVHRPQERFRIRHPIICGVHLQLMGSLANILYREVTHAEGSYLDRFQRILDGKSYCEIDDEFLKYQQARFSQHPEYFHWRHPPKHFEPKNVTATGAVPVSDEDLQALRDAQVPSALSDHRELYPFYWGQGTYDMFSTQ
jgi:hypothetical protein